MRGGCLSQLGLAAAVVVLAVCGAQAHAQDRAKIEVVPNIPHSGWVRSVAFSPDGTRVLSGSEDKTLKLWDFESGQLIRTFEGHTERVSAIAFSPDGRRVLSGSEDKTIRLWDAASGQLIRSFEGHRLGVASVAFSPDGARVLSGGDGPLKLWDAASGRLIRTFEVPFGLVHSVTFSPDGTRVLSGNGEGTLTQWNAASGQLIRTIEGHSNSVNSVAFSPDGTRVLSGSEDKTLKLWDAASGQLIRTFEGHTGQVRSVAFSPNGALVLSGSWDKTLKLWDAASGQLIRTFEGRLSVNSVAFSPDGSQLLSDGAGISQWDVASGQLIRYSQSYSSPVGSVAFSPDGARVLSGSWDKTLKMWDAASGQLIRNFGGHSDYVGPVVFSPNGTRVLSGSWDKTLKMWDAASGQLIRTFEGHTERVSAIAFSPDGRRVLSGSEDKTLKLWDAASGQMIRTFKGHQRGVNSVAFSPDGTRVLSGSWDKTLKMWDAASGQLIRTFRGHTGSIEWVAFSPDGSRLLSWGSWDKTRAFLFSDSWDKTLKMWNAASGQLIRTFEYSDVVTSAALSPDGTRVLSGTLDKTLKLWDAASGQLIRTFEGHAGRVDSVAFSPDGTRLLSGGQDGTVRVWGTRISQPLASLFGSRDGQWLAMTPAGFLAGSGPTDLLGIVRGLEVTTIDQVHQSLFNPDLVREALAGDPKGEVAEAGKVINLEKVLDSGPAPSVAIASTTSGSRAAADLVEVTVRIEDAGKGVGRIEWRVNGVTAAVAAKPEGGGPVYTVAKELALDSGDNVIEVVAYNGSNLLASLPAHTTVEFTAPADTNKPKLHILAIGIDAYVDKGWGPPGEPKLGFGRLHLAVKDAKALGESMKKAAAGLYTEVIVTEALDQDATRDNLHKLIAKLASEVHPRDTFILFAAAHGKSEDGRFHLIPQDYQSGPPGTLARGAIGQDDLQDWLANRIKARKAIVLFDTCESGALIAGHVRSRTDAPIGEAGVGRLHEATGRPVLAAAAADQEAKEGWIGTTGERHGYFTWALLDGLRHGDINGNGLIELSELVAHVQAAVPKIAAGKNIRGLATISVADKQSARFASRGEDYAIARRLQ